MAEVALAAAIVQFADVGWLACKGVSRLYSELENAPVKLRIACQNLKQLLDLVRNLRSDLTALQAGAQSPFDACISPTNFSEAVELVQSCTRTATELEQKLDTLQPKGQDHLLKRAWRAVVTVKRESEILEDFRHLESLKSSLLLWYESRTFSLMEKQL